MSFIDSWLRADIKEIDAYHVPQSDNLLKLDAMESPFPLSDKLISRYLEHLATVQFNRYPESRAINLQQTLRELMGIPAELGILLGNGSDELIQLLTLACGADATILSFEPSFVMYERVAKFTRLNYQAVALTDDFEIDLAKTLIMIDKHQPKLIFIAYPNNPTGNAFNRLTIEKIIAATNALVVLDEAYYAYADDSFLADVTQYTNLVLLRTVSKIGFAGLRLGLLIGSQDTIAELNKLRLPYNMNTLTQCSADFLLREKSQINKNIKRIIHERGVLSAKLQAIYGLKVYPSQANFILFKAPDAERLFAYLQACGILIKNFNNIPKLTHYLRVTIGDSEQNQQFIQTVKNFYD